jgi:hypothetical protein
MDYVTNFHCPMCNKEYTRKSSLDKHKILCEFKMKSKLEKNVLFEEIGDQPKYIELVKIVQEMAIKMTKMESELLEAKKWISKKKKKLNIIEWLNNNSKSDIGFMEWIQINFKVEQQHFELLMENSLFYTIQTIFEHNLKIDEVNPICCFNEKANIFYICEHLENGKCQWKQMLNSDFILILKTLQNKMLKEVSKWKIENHNKMEDNDKLCESFNKAIIKLMNLNLTQDATSSKIKSNLYHYLKKELKLVLSEYEYEFN